MEDRKALKNEELDKVTGGGEYDCCTDSVITTCTCGTDLTLNCEMRRNSSGTEQLRCPNCGTWINLY